MHSIDRDQEKLPSPPQPFNFCCIQSNQSRSRLFLKNGRTSLRFPVQSRSENALKRLPSAFFLSFLRHGGEGGLTNAVTTFEEHQYANSFFQTNLFLPA
jgi:hypothetical protein